MKRLIVLGALASALMSPAALWSQLTKVSGKVTAYLEFPLNKIVVKAKKAKTAAVTDANGYFELDVKKEDVLVIDHDEFAPYSKKISEGTEPLKINLIIHNNPQDMDRVVQNGHISKENLEYGQRNLWERNSEYSRFTSAYDAVKYALPEAQLVTEGGNKGFLLRGAKSISGPNLALMVVNGVVVDDISFVNPVEIKRIYKVPNAQSALYGIRGSNGVIQIETK